MAQRTPQSVAEKWGRRAQGAVQDYKEGVQNVTESPTASAARNLDKAAMNFQQAVSSGRMARRLNAVTRESWIADTLKKGGDRYAGGVAAAVPKMTAFMNDFLPFEQGVVEQVRKMPSMNLEDNIARANAMMRGLAAYRDRR